jgi:hypothetical protein
MQFLGDVEMGGAAAAAAGEALGKKRKGVGGGAAKDGKEGKGIEKDLVVMSKAILAASQHMRILMGIVTLAMHIPTPTAPITSMKQAGTKYHGLTVGQKGHLHGIPSWWLFCGLVRGLAEAWIELTETDEHSQNLNKCVVGLRDFIARIKEIGALKGLVLHCSRRSCKKLDEDTVQLDVITLAVHPDLSAIRDAIILVATHQHKANVLYGPAPPTNLEKEVQKIINRLEPKKA